MRMIFLYLALFTKVEVRASTALIANTLNRGNPASIAGNSVMNLRSLISSSLSKIFYHQPLEGLSSIGSDFILNYLDKVYVEFVLEASRAIASSARHSFSVNLGSIAFEANYAFFIIDSFFLEFGS
jgi:hypothetical protein